MGKSFNDKVQQLPEPAKLSAIFIIGLVASPAVQNTFDELYNMNNAILSGNFTLIAEQLGVSGGRLLYNLILSIALISLFIYLAKSWDKNKDTSAEDISAIKKGVNELLGKEESNNGTDR